ncbi:MalY/PatB family protein [Oceanimonas baumannii]|uniref:cysteine-S-conjugate beta-lyase n=1 Tax=Oceanimonas baumannii TaxID=129578 RepID=A0A235CEP7_9GAMM|nr:PatB family C-S lyase [Oceanimonas baumannii]OYD23091.1 aspartate aminotransferase [Oceanimonas baumannii]TDW58360.1 cystathionine beta-lyase [Oceanimonas baumannii]
MFDFDQWIDRRPTRALKWLKYEGTDILPMWVADTEFKAPPAVINALNERVEHGIFGYSRPTPALTELIITRLRERYGWEIQADWLVYMPGVVPALNLACQTFSEPGSHILMPKPIYYPFLHAPGFHGRKAAHVEMVEKDGRWLLDLESLERQAKDSELLLFCNPHNPGGTIYTREELAAINDIAERHNLIVCSDEIHCDLLLDEGKPHVPYADISDDAANRSIILMAPSKTFNIAGLCCSFAVVPNAELRTRFTRSARGIMADVNLLGFVAAEAAYADGEEWLQAQLGYLRQNRDLLVERLNNVPDVRVLAPEATYLAWVDISALELDDPIGFFEQAGVGLSPGGQFGGSDFVRLNFGCPRAMLDEALHRMIAAINNR